MAQGGLAALQGFSQSLGTGLALVQARRNKVLWDRATQDFERQTAEREAITAGYAERGMHGAADAALQMGRPDVAEAYINVFQRGEAWEMTKADKAQQEFGRTLMAIAPTPQHMLENSEAINRFVQQNPKLWGKVAMLDKERRPVGVNFTETPDGEPLMSIDVYNTRTNSIGPATRDGSARPDDEVMAFKPDVLWSIANSWAGGEQPARGSRGRELTAAEAAPWAHSSDGWLYNKVTGERRPPDMTETEYRSVIYEHADSMAHSQGAMQFDPLQRSYLFTIASEVGDQALSAGFKPLEVMNAAGRMLLTPGDELHKMVFGENADSDSVNQALMTIYERLGMFEAQVPSDTVQSGESVEEESDLSGLPSDTTPPEMPRDEAAAPQGLGAQRRAGRH